MSLGVSSVVNFAFAFIVTTSFLSIESSIGNGFIYGLYAIIVGIGLLFAFYGIPETKAQTVHQINHEIENLPWWTCRTEDEENAPMLTEELANVNIMD
jgi:Sugar (and other) transporter